MRWTWMAALILGCDAKDPEADWDEWDTGAEEVVEEEEEEDEPPAPDSCSWTNTCVEPNEGDNEAWCSGLGDWATYSADSCPSDGVVGSCAFPVGGDFTAPAMAYYYGGDDPEGRFTDAGGTYTSWE